MSAPPSSLADGLEDGVPLTPSHLDFPVVGIGGSAGGLEALLRFFEALPADARMAFVVVLHLSPDHESSAAEILQRVTALPVMQVTARTPIEAGHVYVIAPGANLITDDGHVQPAPRMGPARPSTAIDVFFRALADVHRDKALCIVVSGTGNDGSLGLARVKEQGGIAFAQTPGDAEYGDMPQAAIATGLVDIVLPAADMARRLVALWQAALQMRSPVGEPPVAAPASDADVAPHDVQVGEAAVQEILTLLRLRTCHDFRHYKRATVLRRIARRMQINGQPDIASYRDVLRSQSGETNHLLQDLLISVTSFFRDALSFQALERDVIAQLFQRLAPGDDVRVWVAGCATGEEAYSLSMLLHERCDRVAQPPKIQIFATDINERALASARRGVYPGAISADVSPGRLARFFEQEGDACRIVPAVRDSVIFAKHNLLSDPPFSRLDLICCRNVLIYLDRTAQGAALETFRYALKPGGFLFLGTSEAADAAGPLFTALEPEHHIFRMNDDAAGFGQAGTIGRVSASLVPVPAIGVPPVYRTAQEPPAARLHQRALMSISPPSVLIDAAYEVMHVSPGAEKHLGPSPGVPSLNLLDNVAADMRLELRAALFKAEVSAEAAHARVVRTLPDGARSVVAVAVHPVPRAEHDPQRWLVVFEAVPEQPPATTQDEPVDAVHRLMMARLEEDNRTLKVHLQDTLDRSATSNEELRASNEELQAINEELRSATEELETSKEELQSMNEELTTVNFELQSKVEESGRTNDDLRNLITASDIATVFVDSSLHVKRFTPQASGLFSLVASDVGRPLLDIKSRLVYPEMADDVAAVLSELQPVERQVAGADDERFFARVLPYRAAGNRIAGAVLTFVDVTALHCAEERARVVEEQLRKAIAMSDDFAVVTTDREGIVTSWNAGAQAIFGYPAQEIVSRTIDDIFTPADRAAGVPEAERRTALKEGRADDERWHQRKDASLVFCSGVMTRLQGREGDGFAKIVRDVTRDKRRDAEKDSQLAGEKRHNADAKVASDLKDRFLAVMSHELKQPLNLIHLNAELLTRIPETEHLPSVLRIGETIQRAVATQAKIVDDLLELSRIQTRKLQLNYGDVDVVEVVGLISQAFAKEVERKGITLEVTGVPTALCHCDSVRVEQIVWNLLGNAVKFTPAQGRVTVDVQSDRQYVRLTVSDSGIGIAKAFLPNVFEMFSQAGVQQAGASGKGGLGIGLALVHELARAHGGRVKAASGGVGLGATFTVWLPLRRAIPSPAEPAQTTSLAGLRVLAVDDDPHSLESFAALLRLEGAVVDTAERGAAALDLLGEKAYDLLISDIGMPQMSGLELIAKVRQSASAATRGLRAIAVTGYGREVEVANALKAGFDAHVAKPVSTVRLQEALGSL